MSSSLISRIFSSRNKQLLSAVRANDATRTAQMLDRGVDIEYAPPVKDLVSYSGENALHLACRLGHAECAKVLLARGAKVDAPGPDGLTPLHRWYLQANRIVQRLGWGKVGPWPCRKISWQPGWPCCPQAPPAELLVFQEAEIHVSS